MASLDERTILSLSKLRDPLGIISIYAETTPERQTKSKPEWQIVIENELRRVVQDVKGARDRQKAVTERVEAIDVQRFCDPSRPGRGRALFVPVSSDDDVRELSVQMPMSDHVVLAERAFVRPLVAVLDEGRPSGVAVVSRSDVRILEWAFGEAEGVEVLRFDTEHPIAWREMRGPAPGTPAMAQQTSNQREAFEDRMDENRNRFLRDAAGRMGDMIKDRGWSRLVLFVDGRLDAFEDALDTGVGIVRSEERFGDVPAHEIGERVTSIVAQAQRRREVELVEHAKDRAASGAPACVGIDDTRAAAEEGRIDHLLVSESLGDDTAEALIERALETDATVTPVEGEGAELLASAGGTAALLRW